MTRPCLHSYSHCYIMQMCCLITDTLILYTGLFFVPVLKYLKPSHHLNKKCSSVVSFPHPVVLVPTQIHQMQSFFPCEALPGLYCSCLWFLRVLGVFCLQQVKCMLRWIQVRRLTWFCRLYHFFALKVNVLGCFRSIGHLHRLMSFKGLCWFWADNKPKH